MKIWQPIVNCGYNAGDMPCYFENNYGSFVGFATEEECDEWIANHIFDFTGNEQGGGVFPQEFDVEEPTIIDSDGNVVKIYQEL